MSRFHWLTIPAVLATMVLTVHSSDASAQQAEATASSQATAASSVEVQVRGMREETLKIRRDKAEILRLERDAASVIVGNPDLVSITVETPRRLVIVPVADGMTTLTILDHNGDVISERPVVVSSNADASFIRVRRICPDAAGCEDRDVYYCEDGEGCHTVVSEPTEVAAQTSAASASTGSSGDMGDMLGDLMGDAMSGAIDGTTDAIQNAEDAFDTETPQ